MQQRECDDEKEAENRWLASPHAPIKLWRYLDKQGTLTEDDPTSAQQFQALTRLTGPTVEIVLLDAEMAAACMHDEKRVLDVSDEQGLMRSSLRVTGKYACDAITEACAKTPQNWQRSSVLRHMLLVPMHGVIVARANRYTFRYVMEEGLVMTKNGEEVD